MKRKNRLWVMGYGLWGKFFTKTQNLKPKTQHGFTIVELLIASSIFAVISVAVYTTFSLGMKVWQKAEKLSNEEARVFMKIEKMNRELREVFILKERGLFFWGNKSRMYFPAIVKSEVTKLYYSFDSGSLTLVKGSETLKKILADLEEEKKKKEIKQDDKSDGKEEGKERRFPRMSSYLSGVSDMKFSYLGFDIKKNKTVWKDEWKEETLPLAVKTEIIIKNEKQTSVTFIPCSG